MTTFCPKCQSESTVKNGRDRKLDRAKFLCNACGHQWLESKPKVLSQREQDYWQTWQAHGRKFKPTSRALRDPNTQPLYPNARPEHVRQVIARVQRKLDEGWKLE